MEPIELSEDGKLYAEFQARVYLPCGAYEEEEACIIAGLFNRDNTLTTKGEEVKEEYRKAVNATLKGLGCAKIG